MQLYLEHQPPGLLQVLQADQEVDVVPADGQLVVAVRVMLWHGPLLGCGIQTRLSEAKIKSLEGGVHVN